MSRIGKLPITIPEGVSVTLNGNLIKVKGPLGELDFTFSSAVNVNIEDNIIKVVPKEGEKNANALWGTTRAIIANMIEGTTKGYKKALEINGVGYKFELQGQKLLLSIGYSHKVEMEAPEGITLKLDDKKKNILYVSGIDKQKVGEFAAKIRAKKKPEPYKGKGIKYVGEHIRRKAGKTGK